MTTQPALVRTRAPSSPLPCIRGPGARPASVSLAGYLDRWLLLVRQALITDQQERTLKMAELAAMPEHAANI
jgi:hypothetical protein